MRRRRPFAIRGLKFIIECEQTLSMTIYEQKSEPKETPSKLRLRLQRFVIREMTLT